MNRSAVLVICDCEEAKLAGLSALIRRTFLNGNLVEQILFVETCWFCNRVLRGVEYHPARLELVKSEKSSI